MEVSQPSPLDGVIATTAQDATLGVGRSPFTVGYPPSGGQQPTPIRRLPTAVGNRQRLVGNRQRLVGKRRRVGGTCSGPLAWSFTLPKAADVAPLAHSGDVVGVQHPDRAHWHRRPQHLRRGCSQTPHPRATPGAEEKNGGCGPEFSLRGGGGVGRGWGGAVRGGGGRDPELLEAPKAPNKFFGLN